MINNLNKELTQVMEQKTKLIMGFKDLAASISGITGILFGFISNYIDQIDTLGSVISWVLSTALIIVTGYYYIINAKYKREQLKKIRKQKNENEDNPDTHN